jgi:hypothetical protein
MPCGTDATRNMNRIDLSKLGSNQRVLAVVIKRFDEIAQVIQAIHKIAPAFPVEHSFRVGIAWILLVAEINKCSDLMLAHNGNPTAKVCLLRFHVG